MSPERARAHTPHGLEFDDFARLIVPDMRKWTLMGLFPILCYGSPDDTFLVKVRFPVKKPQIRPQVSVAVSETAAAENDLDSAVTDAISEFRVSHKLWDSLWAQSRSEWAHRRDGQGSGSTSIITEEPRKTFVDNIPYWERVLLTLGSVLLFGVTLACALIYCTGNPIVQLRQAFQNRSVSKLPAPVAPPPKNLPTLLSELPSSFPSEFQW